MKEENNKEEIRRLVIDTALKEFTEKGIKDVKMDDIAARLSMSKRTIYELFSDKAEILHEAMKVQNAQMLEKGRVIIRGASDVLDTILKLYSLYLTSLRNINKKFFTEIKKYPDVWKHNRTHEAQYNKQFLAWMELGRKQGLFREDANFEIFSFMLHKNLETIFIANIEDEDHTLAKYSPEELGRVLFIFYLRGISTLKGQEIIENYLKENK